MSSSQSVAICGTRGIPARYGGFETFAEELSARLAAQGYQVTVYARHSFSKGLLPKISYIENIRVISTPTVMHKYLETPLHGLTSFIDLLFRKVDVALVCNAANAPFLPLLKLKSKLKVSINVDGIEKQRKKWNRLGSLWYELGERAAVWFSDVLISDAQVIADYYEKTYGRRSQIIAYGARNDRREPGENLASFGLKPSEYVLYVSRLEPENNALGVIEAYKMSGISLPLVIVGDAPYADEYKAQLKHAAQGHNVIFTGFQFGEAYREFLSNCALYIQATEVGGTHPALIEAMALGSAVIANGTSENTEVLGDAGWLYPVNDFSALAELMKEVLSSTDEMARRSELAAKRTREHYSWDAVTEKYCELFAKLVT